MPAKVGIKSLLYVLKDVFHLYMDIATHAAAIVFDQTRVVSIGNAG